MQELHEKVCVLVLQCDLGGLNRSDSTHLFLRSVHSDFALKPAFSPMLCISGTKENKLTKIPGRIHWNVQ